MFVFDESQEPFNPITPKYFLLCVTSKQRWREDAITINDVGMILKQVPSVSEVCVKDIYEEAGRLIEGEWMIRNENGIMLYIERSE